MENEMYLDECETQIIMNFIAHCNNFLDGKYLFATSKLKEISEDIQQSKDLSLLKKECLDGFNASLFKTKCLVKLPTKNGTFTSPTEKEDFIALAFTFIDDICNEVVDYDDFTAKYFYSEKNENKFAKQIIEPLKLVIAKLFGLPEDNEAEFVINQQQTEIEVPVVQNDNSSVIAVVDNLIDIIAENAKGQHCQNALVILRELRHALDLNLVDEIKALYIALCYITPYISCYQYMFDELEYCLNRLYKLNF